MIKISTLLFLRNRSPCCRKIIYWPQYYRSTFCTPYYLKHC